MKALLFAALAAGVLAAGAAELTDYEPNLQDRCWMWGHDSGMYDKPGDPFNIPPSEKISMADACAYMGVSNVSVVIWYLPDEEYCAQFRNLKRVAWVVDNGDLKQYRGKDILAKHLEFAFRKFETMPNLMGVEFDDYFFQPQPPPVRETLEDGSAVEVVPGPRTLKDIRRTMKRLHAYRRPIDARIVVYERDLGSEAIRPVVNEFDTVMFWTWTGANVAQLRENFARYRRLVPKKRTLLGIYMWDFGGRKPIGVETMKIQLDFALEKFRCGEIDGVIFHCTPLVNKNLPEVEMCRRWIAEHGQERIGSHAAPAAGVLAGCGDVFEAERAALLAKPRQLIADNDGCDMLYYSRKLPITEKAFIDSRIGAISGTRLDTLVYTPISAGFGMFTALKAGEPLLRTIPYQQTTNAVLAFKEKVGKDCLEMAIGFCRREKREIFVGVRLNDTHDSDCDELLPQWKRDNPDVLFGTKENRPPVGGRWSAVDFENPKVRAYMKRFMRQFFENYDIDGVCYDFNRHFHLFKSVAWGKDATAEQLDLMSRFMRELKDLADECGRRRGRPILVLARVYDSPEYIRAAGIDLERWLDERSVDMLATGGYFRLNPWKTMADVAHRHGVKVYASMDESRIGWLPTPFHPYGFLKGRNEDKFAAARIAEAMAEGMDGVFFFNTQLHWLHKWASIDPKATEGLDKEYFAVERGSGGALPWHYVPSGEKYSNYCRIDPWRPPEVKPGNGYDFTISIGDNLDSEAAKARPSKATALVMMNYTQKADVRLGVNGETLSAASFTSDNTTNGVFRFDVPLAKLHRGRNGFRLLAPKDRKPQNADGRILFVDFKLCLDY